MYFLIKIIACIYVLENDAIVNNIQRNIKEVWEKMRKTEKI